MDSKPEFKLIIAGGREFTDQTLMAAEVDKLRANELKGMSLSIVCGMARGADITGLHLAQDNDIPVHRFPANWDKHGKSAGYKRNTEMAEFADGLLAFHDGQSKGTKHMIDIAKRHGLSVRVINY